MKSNDWVPNEDLTVTLILTEDENEIMEASLLNQPTASWLELSHLSLPGSSTWPPGGTSRVTILVTDRVRRGQSPDPPQLLLEVHGSSDTFCKL